MRTKRGRTSSEKLADGIARWNELVLLGPDGEPDATISATSYVRASERPRPVVFLWNGGPGASSSPLHMNALGPRILLDGAVTPNEHSLLDIADLIFVDPVGTGFSRILREEAKARLLTVADDAIATEIFVRDWLAANEREEASIHLVGESFGGYRLAAVAPHLTDLRLDGIVLISPMLDATAVADVPENDLLPVFQLPALAVAAWAHGRARTDTDRVQEIWEDAERFAIEDLLPALHLSGAIDDSERTRLAVRMGEMLGLTAEEVLAAGLRIGSEDYLRTLRRDEGLLIGRLDVRVSGPLPEPDPDGRPPAADDPALGIGRNNVIHSTPIARYLREELGAPVADDEDYVSLSLELNFDWDWRAAVTFPPVFRTSVVQGLGEVAMQRPGLRILLLGGYFDLATPLSSTIHAMRHAGVPNDRIDIHPLLAGHSLDQSVLAEARVAIADLIEQTSKARSHQ